MYRSDSESIESVDLTLRVLMGAEPAGPITDLDMHLDPDQNAQAGLAHNYPYTATNSGTHQPITYSAATLPTPCPISSCT